MVSCQFRQVTLDVLSTALGVLLSKEDIWRCVKQPRSSTPSLCSDARMCLELRMESKPWRKIQTARKFCAWTGKGDGLPQSEAEALETCSDSPVLSVYIMMHALNRRSDVTATRSSMSTGVLNAGQLRHNCLESEEMTEKALSQYKRCPDAFKALLQLRFQLCMSRLFVSEYASLDGSQSLLANLTKEENYETPLRSVGAFRSIWKGIHNLGDTSNILWLFFGNDTEAIMWLFFGNNIEASVCPHDT